MTTANHLINVLASEDREQANEVFTALIQDKVADALEVAKVEIASSIMGVVEEETIVETGYNDNVPSLKGKAVPHKYTYEKEGKTRSGTIHAEKSRDNAKAAGAIAVKHGIKVAHIRSIEAVNEGAGMDAQRRWVRQVAAIGKEGSMKPMHRDSLKSAARKYFQTYKPHGAEFVEKGAQAVKGARQMLKQKRLQGEETELTEGGPTRKHFQQVADLLKNIPDEAKRKELAQHHAGLFKQQNPRFDHKRFYAAAGVSEALEPGSKPQSNGTLNRNVTMNIRRAVQALNLKGINPQMASQGHRDFTKLAMKNPKAPGYMLLRKLSPNKAQAVQGLTQAGVPLGSALDANPTDFNQVLQRIKRFK